MRAGDLRGEVEQSGVREAEHHAEEAADHEVHRGEPDRESRDGSRRPRLEDPDREPDDRGHHQHARHRADLRDVGPERGDVQHDRDDCSVAEQARHLGDAEDPGRRREDR